MDRRLLQHQPLSREQVASILRQRGERGGPLVPGLRAMAGRAEGDAERLHGREAPGGNQDGAVRDPAFRPWMAENNDQGFPREGPLGPAPIPFAPVVPAPEPLGPGEGVHADQMLRRMEQFARMEDMLLRRPYVERPAAPLFRQASVSSSSPPEDDEGIGGIPRTVNVVVDGDVIAYSPQDEQQGAIGLYISDRPLTDARPFFEVEILDKGDRVPNIVVGLCSQRYPLDLQPGWTSESIGFHVGDGTVYRGRPRGQPFGPGCDVGDKIGCGIRPSPAAASSSRQMHHPPSVATVFFTRNGKEIGNGSASLSCVVPLGGLHPVVGLQYLGEEVSIRQGVPWSPEEDMMLVDGGEDEWLRLHDIKINGQVLEYVGRGKSLVDVGLAQAKTPICTRNHYFEIEIVDPGTSCYIAIGLARKDYPKNRHPGWNKGWRHRYLSRWDHIPGPKSWTSLPLIGHSYLLGGDSVSALAGLHARHGHIFRIDLGPAPTIVIADYDLAAEAYRKEAFSSRPHLPGIAGTRGIDPDGCPGGIIFSSGRAFRENKSVFTKALTDLGMVRGGDMEEIISQEVDMFCELLRGRRLAEGAVIAINEMFVRVSNSIIWRLGTGKDNKQTNQELDEVISAMLEYHYASNPGSLWFTLVNSYNPALSIARALGLPNVVTAAGRLIDFVHREVASGTPNEDGYIVDRLLAEIDQNEKDAISSTIFKGQSGRVHTFGNVFDLFVAGTDTVSTFMEWAVYYLVCFPEVQERVYQEIRSAVGEARSPTMGDRAATPYCVAAIEEVMRFTPMTNLTLPHATDRETELAGLKLPAGTRVGLLHSSINMSKKHFSPDPRQFRPDRHLGPDGAFRSTDRVVFFGLGKRRCAGEVLARAESYMMFATTFQNFRFSATPGFVPMSEPAVPGLINYPPKFQARVDPR